MTLIFDRGGKEPGLHALVIGVANYPHLIGGSLGDATMPLGLKQIKAPYRSALDVAEWLQTRYRKTGKPLASLELLVSPPSVPVNAGTLEQATMDNIRTKFHQWRTRASENPDNVAFFYFCGHGLNNNGQLLLAEDFGGDPNPFVKSINFDGTLAYMGTCAARTQVYFIDACSNTPAVLNYALGNSQLHPMTGETLIFNPTARRIPQLAVYYAADEGEAAFAPDDGSATYFSRALLSCLERGSGQNKQGQWVTDTGRLLLALQDMLRRLVRQHGLPRLSVRAGNNSEAVDLNEISNPKVLTWLDCRTSIARRDSAILMMNLRRYTETYRSPRGENRPWLHEVTPGIWRVDAVFNNYTRYRKSDLSVFPPCFEHEIDR